jgi:hypothetical protein
MLSEVERCISFWHAEGQCARLGWLIASLYCRWVNCRLLRRKLRAMNEYLPDEIVLVHRALVNGGLPHAFGGAVAFAYCGVPRYTQDIDVNVFLSVDHSTRVLQSLASLFTIENHEQLKAQLSRDAQVRLFWGDLPIDIYLNNLEFHEAMSERVRLVDYVGITIPVLSAEDLIICKAAFNRSKDWVDIEQIFEVQGTRLELGYIMRWLTDLLGERDPRLGRINQFWRDVAGRSVSDDR